VASEAINFRTNNGGNFLMTIFDKPIFAVPDALTAEMDLQAKYTELTGKQLFPAQPETLLTNWSAYLKTVSDALIQYTGEQCLINFADGVNLDRLGDFWDAPRLPPQKAITTLEFTLTTAQGTDYLILEGTQVITANQQIIFETTDLLTIIAGQTTGQITAQATITGTQANGYAIGQITQLITQLPEIDTVSNLTISNGGSDTETDERYRQRLLLAPNKINTAGSRDAYRYWTLTVDPNITSVSVVSPGESQRLARAIAVSQEITEKLIDKLEDLEINTDGVNVDDIYNIVRPYIYFPRFFVEVYILVNNQLPSPEIIEKVQQSLDNSQNRPLTDVVNVLSPVPVEQDLTIEITATIDTNLTDLNTQLNQLLDTYISGISSSMGVDIVPSQIIQRLQIPGVYEVKIIEPSVPVMIRANELAVIPNHTLTITGVKEQ
jgi:phage-related baseplate assembly protein